MVSKAHPRFIHVMLGSVVVLSMLACGRSGPLNQTRLGDDMIVRGSSVNLDERDTVSGDAILIGRDVKYHSAIGGDYLGVGGQQTIGGRIHGSVRAVGGEIHVSGVIDRNATIAGGSVVMDSTGDIGRNAYFTGGTVQLSGTVRGGLLASGGAVILDGTVDHDVEVGAGELRVGPHAVITGALRYRVPARKVHIDPAARISGTVTALPVSTGWGPKHWLWMLGFILVGVVVVAVFPRFTTEAAAILAARPVRSGLVGFGWFILVPIAIIIAAVTIIGLPLALLTTLLYVVLVSVSSIPFSVWVGGRLLSGRARAGRQGAIMNFLVGDILLLAVGLIPVLGPIVTAIAGCLGLGSIVLRAKSLRAGQPVLA